MENGKKLHPYAAVVKMAQEHREMLAYLEMAVPFLKNVKGCSVYQDGLALLKKVQSK